MTCLATVILIVVLNAPNLITPLEIRVTGCIEVQAPVMIPAQKPGSGLVDFVEMEPAEPEVVDYQGVQ